MNKITPQDLRIGNYVKVEQNVYKELSHEPPILNCYFTVQELTYNSIYIYNGEENAGHYNDGIIGIPITEELLHKSNLTAIGTSTNTEYFMTESEFGDIEIEQILVKGERWVFSVGKVNKTVKYIHEIQNLFNSLTGQELEINLK